jgi:hypothetical protein
MIFSAYQHRTIAEILREKARRAPNQTVAADLLKMAHNHEMMAKYLDKNPDRYKGPTVTSPPLAPG